MKRSNTFGGDTRLVLQSVGTADATALRAIRQLVPGAIQDVARLVYQAPSELTTGLTAAAAAEMQTLLGGLGFSVTIAAPDTEIKPGVGAFEIALVVGDIGQLPQVIAEAAAFLGADLATARRLVCRSPAVLVSKVSAATVDAVRNRFRHIGVDIDVSQSSQARYYAVVAADNAGLRRVVADVVRAIAGEATVTETPAAVIVEGLGMAEAQALWERLQRTGARASVCNRDLERYDISLQQAPETADMREMLVGQGIPARVVPRVLGKLPVVIRQNVDHVTMRTLLDDMAARGAVATALPHSFQRFSLIVRSVKDAAEASRALMAFGDMPAAAAASAVNEGRGTPFGSFTRTTALWLQHVLTMQGAEAEVHLS